MGMYLAILATQEATLHAFPGWCHASLRTICSCALSPNYMTLCVRIRRTSKTLLAWVSLSSFCPSCSARRSATLSLLRSCGTLTLSLLVSCQCPTPAGVHAVDRQNGRGWSRSRSADYRAAHHARHYTHSLHRSILPLRLVRITPILFHRFTLSVQFLSGGDTGDDDTRAYTASLLAQLTRHEGGIELIMPAMAPLVACIQSSHSQAMHEAGLSVLRTLADHGQAEAHLLRAGAVPCVVSLLSASPAFPVLEAATDTLQLWCSRGTPARGPSQVVGREAIEGGGML
jgi:hypothetical protein